MSLTIKQAFEALSDACANGMKNPFFVMRRLKESFADVASKVEAGGDKVTVTQTLTEGTEIGSIKVNNDTTKLYAPAGSSGQNYSTNERVIGKWIDGTTDVYEKYFNITSYTVGTPVDLGLPKSYTIIDGGMTFTLANGAVVFGLYQIESYVNPQGNNTSVYVYTASGDNYLMGCNIPSGKEPSNIYIKLRYIKPAN